MGEQKRKKEQAESSFVFQKSNYKIMLFGLAFIALGFILMAGGGSQNPEVFNPEIYSWRRIRLAPALILIGFALEVYAILKTPGKPQS